MALTFQKATKAQSHLRLSLQGPSGAGKTYSALNIATYLGKRIALIDTERGSASMYAHLFDFAVCEIYDNYNPERLHEALAASANFDVVIIDSLTHFWNGPGGMLEMVDDEVKRQKQRGNKPDSFSAWKSVDGVYRRVVQALLAVPADVIVTMRAKTEYERSEDSKGKSTIKKLGMAPEMRNSFEYEMSVEGMLDDEHNLMIGKTRCEMLDRKTFHKPGKELADTLKAWLTDGAPMAPKAPSSDPYVVSATLAAEFVSDIEKASTLESLIVIRDRIAAERMKISNNDLAQVRSTYSDREKELAQPRASSLEAALLARGEAAS